MQARYQVHIRHDGKQYVACVPELDGCHGVGDTYSEALAAAERAMTAWVFGAINAGCSVPRPAQDFVWRPPGRKPSDGPAADVMQRLRKRHGNLSNRDLAAKLGLPHKITPVGVAAAASGQGARAVRVALALAVGEQPSILWPHRSSTISARDDATFQAAASGAVSEFFLGRSQP